MLKNAKTKKREPIVETSIWGVPFGVMLLSLVTCKCLYIKIVSFQKFTIQRWEGAYNITNKHQNWVGIEIAWMLNKESLPSKLRGS